MANEKKMDVVILGLLSHEPMTGYEIKKIIDNQLKYFWSGSFGSIYPTLNFLESEKAIEKVENEVTGRGKITYAITDVGRQKLKMWLDNPVSKDELKYESLLKLFFGGELGKESVLRQIGNFEEKISKELAMLQFFEKNLESSLNEDEDHLYFLLTVRFGIETYKAHLKWCKDAKNMLK